MKKSIFFLLMLLVATLGFGQKKGKPDPKDLKIDSLTKSTAALTMQLDSVSKDREMYYGVYTAIKDKVIKYNFKPTRTSSLIDSLRESRDSTFALSSASLKDSISALKTDNGKLKITVDSLLKADADKTKLVTELKQLKDLLDAKIITQAEFDSKKNALMEKWQ
jgi:hypothetical protein